MPAEDEAAAAAGGVCIYFTTKNEPGGAAPREPQPLLVGVEILDARPRRKVGNRRSGQLE